MYCDEIILKVQKCYFLNNKQGLGVKKTLWPIKTNIFVKSTKEYECEGKKQSAISTIYRENFLNTKLNYLLL